MNERLLTEAELAEIEDIWSEGEGRAGDLDRLIADHRRMREAITSVDPIIENDEGFRLCIFCEMLFDWENMKPRHKSDCIYLEVTK